jgi:thymidylate synthase
MEKKFSPNTKNWPVYFKEVLKLGDLKSNVGIVTLWTPLEKIVSGLKETSYALVGQLYSQGGVNFIVRNILANPKIRYLIICGKEHKRERSGQALINLIKKGVDKDNRIIGTKNGRIDKEIPKKAIEEFRKGVKVFDLRNIEDPKKIQQLISKLPPLKEFTYPRIYPLSVAQFPTFPNDRTPEKIKAESVADAWPRILGYVMHFGSDAMTNYGTVAREVLNLIAVITKENPYKPKLKPFFKFSAKDILSYIKEEFISPKIKDSSRYYTYGERLRAMPPKGIDQVEIIIKKLKKDPNDRGAIAVLWSVERDNYLLRNPCLVLVQGKITKDTFDLTCYFRSNDMFNAWPLNAFGLRALQYEIAKKIKKKVGILTTISHCAHIYQENWKEAEEIFQKYGKEKFFHEWDPRGNFVIRVEKGKIKVWHFSPDGKDLLEKYEGESAKEILDQIETNFGISQISHACYLGRELQKAEIALKKKLKYLQDHPLKF